MLVNRSFLIGAAAAASICIGGAAVFSQPDDKSKPAQPPAHAEHDMAAMMAEYAKTMNPGEHHKTLEPFVGTWTTVSKMYMEGPDGPATESKGVSTKKWILGNRFIVENFKGEMMMPNEKGELAPSSFEGTGMTGFNNFRGMYEGTWADTWGTQLLTFSGSLSHDQKTLTMYGTMDEPGMRIIGRHVRYETKWIDKDTYVFVMYDLHAGEDHKAMEITYTRDKK